MVTYLIDKSDITSIRKIEIDRPPLQDGQVRFKIEKAGLTANNITYAVLGESFKYWDFFPHEDGGILPVWGYAKVIESRHPKVEEGKRFYGYYPLAEELVVRPLRVNEYGFVDGTIHRQQLPQVYNYYENDGKSGVSPDIEDAYMIFQPLFATSFLLAHFFMDNDSFGAEEVYITSASSKTALAFAAVLKQMNESIRLIGITSKKNVAFCESTGLYHSLISYGQIEEIMPTSCVIVDFAGNRSVMVQLQNKLGIGLNKSITVGLSHWDQTTGEESMPFKSELFFAPDHAVEKQKEWGGKEFKMRLNRSLIPFLKKSVEWLQYKSTKETMALYRNLIDGEISPGNGIIVTL